jgi:hypothetical protein
MKTAKAFSIFLALLTIFLSATSSDAQTRQTRNAKPVVYVYGHTAEELRKATETRMLKGEHQHDGSGVLAEVGTMESGPALLRVLKDNQGTPIHHAGDDKLTADKEIGGVATKPKKLYICTYVHAVMALKKITGQDFIEYEDWMTWWKGYRHEHPFPE